MEEYNDIQIDDFLLGRMEGSELERFNKKISLDKEFADRVKARQEIVRYIDLLGDLEMKKRVKNLHQKEINKLPKPTNGFRIIPFLKYAAAIALILVAGYWFLLQPPSGADIYQEHYQAYALNFGERSNATQDITFTAGQFYQDGIYTKALDLFQTIPKDSVSAKITLAKGICFLETNQLDEAAQSFQTLIDQQDIIYEDHARWYLALTFLKEEKIDQAKNLLRQIAEKERSFKQDEAKAVLKSL